MWLFCRVEPETVDAGHGIDSWSFTTQVFQNPHQADAGKKTVMRMLEVITQSGFGPGN
jgi:hypothetical protein